MPPVTLATGARGVTLGEAGFGGCVLRSGWLCLFCLGVSLSQRKCLKKSSWKYTTGGFVVVVKGHCSPWFAMCQKSEHQKINRNPREINKCFQVVKIFLGTWWCGESNDWRKMRGSDLFGTLKLVIQDTLSLLVFGPFLVISLLRLHLSTSSSRHGVSHQRHNRTTSSTGTVLQTNKWG